MKLPSPRADLLASDRDWRARFRFGRRMRAIFGRAYVRRPFAASWLGRYDISRALRDTRSRRNRPIEADYEEMPE